MSKGLNKVMLIGNLGADPICRRTKDGFAITNISLATTSIKKSKDNVNIEQHTEWHKVVFFGKLAEVVEKYLKKGKKVYIEGHLSTTKWDKNGETRYTTQIIAEEMQMLDNKTESEATNTAVENIDVDRDKDFEMKPTIDDDDIPF
jgi:single-strand DNA-binding protein